MTQTPKTEDRESSDRDAVELIEEVIELLDDRDPRSREARAADKLRDVVDDLEQTSGYFVLAIRGQDALGPHEINTFQVRNLRPYDDERLIGETLRGSGVVFENDRLLGITGVSDA